MEIHIGNRVADVTLVSKEDNKVRLNVDGRIYDVDIAMAENGAAPSYTTEILTIRKSSAMKEEKAMM